MDNNEIYRKAKADIYRKIGKVCAITWTAILLLLWAVSLVRTLLSGHIYFGLALRFLLMIPLGNIIYNPLLLVSIILFWRADKNEKPEQKSKWLNFLLAYIGSYFLLSLLLSLYVMMYRRPTYRPMSIEREEKMKAILRGMKPAEEPTSKGE